MRNYREFETLEINGEQYRVHQEDIGLFICKKVGD